MTDPAPLPQAVYRVLADLNDAGLQVRVPATVVRDAHSALRSLAQLGAEVGAVDTPAALNRIADALEAAARAEYDARPQQPEPMTSEQLLEEVGLRR